MFKLYVINVCFCYTLKTCYRYDVTAILFIQNLMFILHLINVYYSCVVTHTLTCIVYSQALPVVILPIQPTQQNNTITPHANTVLDF